MKYFVGYGVLVIGILIALASPAQLESANLITVKDTLSTSRLSFHGRINSSGSVVGSSLVTIQTSTGLDSASEQANSISTGPLRAQDSLTIGANTYTIVDIIDGDEFSVSPVLLAGDADNNDPIYLNVKPIHTITFTTPTAVANGFFQILLPADANASTAYDGKADDQGFDMTTGGVTVSATDVGSTYDFVTGVSTRSGDTGCTAPANYHCLEVHYSGVGAVSQAISITIGSGANTPIAPSTGTAHTEGIADTYPVLIKNFGAGANPNSASPIDSSSVRVAVIESVRVTATVDPTISFSIAGISANSGSYCGVTRDAASPDSTATAVPFGSIANLETFYDAVQNLTVTTNSASGYVVTGQQNDEMSRDGLGVTIIPDTSGDATATYNNADDWETATNNGFGYSLENVDAAAITFEWDGNAFQDCNSDITGDFCSRQFAIGGSETAQTLFSSTTVASNENAYVCYRLSVDPTQAAGDYENQITYIATGTF